MFYRHALNLILNVAKNLARPNRLSQYTNVLPPIPAGCHPLIGSRELLNSPMGMYAKAQFCVSARFQIRRFFAEPTM
jgi:hypothetical protein